MSKETEDAWKGEFGDEYTQRNTGRIMANALFLAPILRRMNRVERLLEIGCGAGENLAAVQSMNPNIIKYGVEINDSAARFAAYYAHVYCASALEFFKTDASLTPPVDLVMTKGFLIHVSPDERWETLAGIAANTTRYVLLAEYYAPSFEPVLYRGRENMMWRGPWARKMQEVDPRFELIDYGFSYSGDLMGQDDMTWFLLERRP